MIIKRRQHQASGFSLFELLMTVALFGIMGSLAITAFGEQSSTFEKTRDRRNAQEIANVSCAASAAGLNFVTSDQLDTTVRHIIQGDAPKSGAFKGRVFKVSLINEDDVAGAMKFLAIEKGELRYRNDS